MGMKRTKMVTRIGDVYTLQERETRKWFAFQIVQLNDEGAVYVDLDYWDDRKPVSNDLNKMHVLYLTHHSWNNKAHTCWSDNKRFPTKAELVGNVPVLYDGECRVYGNWPDGTRQKKQEWWKQVPIEQTEAYQKVDGQWNESVVVAGKDVPKNLYSVDDEMLDAVDDYAELDKLPRLSRIVTTRYRSQLIPFLERRWLIQELVWTHCGQPVLDLRKTHIEKLEVSDSDVKEIHLPQGISHVTLKGGLSPNLRMYSSDDGYSLTLLLEQQNGHMPNLGLPNLKDLVLHDIKEFDLSSVSAYYPNLIWLGLKGHPGIIHHVSSVSKLKELETLVIHDLFGFSTTDFPLPADLPKLQSLWLTSVPAEAGKAIKRLYKNKISDLCVIKLRSDEWLQENMNNPLRHWDGKDSIPKSKYNKAVALLKETRRRMVEAAKERDSFSMSMIPIVSEYIEGFNKLDEGSSFIETEEREDIYNAFESILDEMEVSVDHERVLKIMDERRNW